MAEKQVNLTFTISDGDPRVLTWHGDNGCRPATEPECELWDALHGDAPPAGGQQGARVLTEVEFQQVNQTLRNWKEPWGYERAVIRKFCEVNGIHLSGDKEDSDGAR